MERYCASALVQCNKHSRRCPISLVPFPLARTAFTLSVVLVSTGAPAEADPYHITAYEKAACIADATQFCADTYPDEHKLLTCMMANRASLNVVCKVAFNAGLKRRHIH